MADLSDKALDKIEANIDEVLNTVNAKITRLIAQLKTTKDGRLAKMELARMRSTRKAIIKELSAFREVVDDATNYAGVTVAVKARMKKIAFSFTQSDHALVKFLSDSAYNELSSVVDNYALKISNAVIKGSITGTPISDIEIEVAQLLKGGTTKSGRSLASYAKTFTNTEYMEVDRALTLKAAENIGSDKFRYSGSLIKDSRPFCQERAGKVYTKEEIEAWRDKSWAGKKEGDPFVVLGGYNCRHFLVPVIEG